MKNRCAWVEVLENRGCFRCRCVWRQVEVSLGCFSRRDQRSELVGIQSHRALLSALSTSVSVCTGTKQREQECERWASSTSSSLFPVYCSPHFYGSRFIDPLNVGYNVQLRTFFTRKLLYLLGGSVCNFLGTPQILLQAEKVPPTPLRLRN